MEELTGIQNDINPLRRSNGAAEGHVPPISNPSRPCPGHAPEPSQDTEAQP